MWRCLFVPKRFEVGITKVLQPYRKLNTIKQNINKTLVTTPTKCTQYVVVQSAFKFHHSRRNFYAEAKPHQKHPWVAVLFFVGGTIISVYYAWKLYIDDHFFQTAMGNDNMAMHSLSGDLKGTKKATPEIFTDKSNYLAIKGKIEEAIVEANNALEINPTYTPALCSLSQLYRRKGEYQKSLEYAQKVIELDPQNYFGHFDKGATLMKMGQLDEALSSLSTSWNLNTTLVDCARLQALILSEKGDYVSALQMIGSGLIVKPGDVKLKKEAAVILFRLGQFYESLRTYDDLLLKEPQNKEFRRNRALVLSRMGKYQEAIVDLDIILQDSKEPDASLFNDRVNVLFDLNRRDEALEFLESSLQTFPHDKMLRCNKARIFSELGKNAEAISILNTVLKEDAKFSIAYNLKGQALENIGKKKDAIVCYKKALEMNPFDAFAQEKLK